MIPIPLGKSMAISVVTGIEINQMTRHSCKPNELRNVNTIRMVTRIVVIQKWEIDNVKIKIIAFVKFWIKQNCLELLTQI